MIVIDESLTAKGYTPAALVPTVFLEPRVITSITIHHWGALGQTHDGVTDFFVNGPGQTSAHFVVSDGRITCLVSPADAAWHTGTAHGNATSIGIECRPEATDGDYAAVAQLVMFLRTTYGQDLPLIPHRQWFNTACPGVWDLDRINTLVTTGKDTPAMAAADINYDLIHRYCNENGDRVINDTRAQITALGTQLAAHLGMDPDALAAALLKAGTLTITPKAVS
jgi:hypothetical protein